MKLSFAVLSSLGLVWASNPAAAESGVSVQYQYEDAASGERVKNTISASLAQSNEAMEKTVLVVESSAGISEVLQAWAKTCEDYDGMPEPNEDGIGRPRPGHDLPPPPREMHLTEKCKAEKLAVESKILAAVKLYSARISDLEKKNFDRLRSENSGRSDSQLRREAQETKLKALMETLHKLAASMHKAATEPKAYDPCRGRCYPERSPAPMPNSPGNGGGMNISGGGAQDAQRFRDLVDAGQIPEPSDYQAYGLMNEFDLSLPNSQCAQLLCVAPVLSVDEANKKLYVRTAISTNVTVNGFKRRPINLAVNIDLSGSMESTDNTKQSRLEWAKEAVRKTLDSLVEGQDYFTLVGFSDNAEMLWPKNRDEVPHPITKDDKAAILSIVRGLHTLGSTNLRAGLDLAYVELNSAKKKLARQHLADGYESRVIMITDANLNTGDTDESSAVIEVEKQSRVNGINLTTIGVGANFFAKFIDKVSILRGSNYIFAQDGQRMLEYFNQFDTLVTPVAYDFVARVELEGLRAKLVRIHGVPEFTSKPATDSLINISTLFFSAPEKGGGAQVLEYSLE